MKRLCLIIFIGSIIRIVPAAIVSELQQERAEQKFLTFQVINPELNLYEIDDHFALQAIYINQELSEIRVLPKYEFEQSRQMEFPDLKWISQERYTELLKQIQDIKPLGKIVKPCDVGVSSNNVTSWDDQYEFGVIYYDTKRLPSDNLKKIGKKGYLGFHITFFREVSGKLIEKEILNGNVYMMKIDNKWYRTTENEYRNHKVGENVIVKSAAPFVVQL